MLIFVNILAFVAWAVVTTLLLRPFLGVWATLVSLPIFAYPLYALFYADKLVAGQAGFRRPTGLQEKYFEFLGIKETVWTYPSSTVAAGVLAGARGKTFLVTAGLTRYLTDEEIKYLIRGLDRRDYDDVFNWTYHLATGAAMLFAAAPKSHYAGEWTKLVFASLVMIASLTTSILVIYINALSGVLPIWLAVAALLIPFFALVAWLGWAGGVMTMSRLAARKWNKSVWVGDLVLRPMRRPTERFQGLHLLGPGLVEALDLPEFRDGPDYEPGALAGGNLDWSTVDGKEVNERWAL